MKTKTILSSTKSYKKSPAGIFYQEGNELVYSEDLIFEKAHEIKFWELFKTEGVQVAFAKKCGADGNVESTNWDNCKAFAEKMFFNGKTGHLLSKEVFKENWDEELPGKVEVMDKFLVKNGIDAETRSAYNFDFYGFSWCCEIEDKNSAYFFDLMCGDSYCANKYFVGPYDRLAVAFV